MSQYRAPWGDIEFLLEHVFARDGQAALDLDLARSVVWLLRSQDAEIRRLAVELAQSVQDPHGELWPKLLGCLRDEDWWVRERLADVLVERAGPALLPHVVPYLQDPAPVMRQSSSSSASASSKR